MRAAALLALLAALAACQSAPSGGPGAPQQGKSAALLAMENIAIAAHRCWFASRDPAFRNYSFANELNSFSGRPRFLLVPHGNFGGRPLLVVQAEGTPARVQAFGPLMEERETGSRIAADVNRWAGGDAGCA